MSTKLMKPCPFCGGSDTELLRHENPVGTYDDYDYGGYYFYVQCNNCLAQSGRSIYEDTAIEHWNERHYNPKRSDIK